MDIHTILIIGHLIGTIIGVGGATFIEIHLNLALADGKMDEADKKMLARDFLMTRIGLALAVITGLGFIAEYASYGVLSWPTDGVFWAKMTMIVIIVINAYLLHKHKVGLYWGSAFSFVSWWGAFLLGTFLSNGVKFFPGNLPVSFLSIMVVYGVIIVAGAFVLDRIRKMTKMSVPPRSTPQ